MSEDEESHKSPAKKKKKNSNTERKTYRCRVIKGTVTRFFALDFFHENHLPPNL
jgi:hypothetical protein